MLNKFLSFFRKKRRVVELPKKNEFLGSSKRKRGQYLFGYDPDTNTVYKVKTEKVIELDPYFEVEVQRVTRAHVAPTHKLVWAINYKNAIRKFPKL